MAEQEKREPSTRRKKKPVVYEIKPRNRFWEVRDPRGDLMCLTVYKRGAAEVVRRLAG